MRGTHNVVEHRPRSRLALAKIEKETEGKKTSPPVDVVCLNENPEEYGNEISITSDGRDQRRRSVPMMDFKEE